MFDTLATTTNNKYYARQRLESTKLIYAQNDQRFCTNKYIYLTIPCALFNNL